jgi:hypothetical protein
MNGLNLVELDHRLEQASRAWRAWRMHVRSPDPDALRQDPFVGRRDVSTRATWQALQAMPPELPERESLMRWVAALTLDRVTFEDAAELHGSRNAERHPVRSLGGAWNVGDLALECVVHPEQGRRDAAARALLSRCEDAGSNALFWLARRHEAAVQLGTDLGWLEAPLKKGTDVASAAAAWVAPSDDISAEFGKGGPWHEWLHAGAALEAVEGWPAQLSAQWIYDLLRHTGLADGLKLQVDALPQARSGASFVRALDRFGVAIYRAQARRITGLFAMAVRPFDPRPAAYGALFASLLASPLFLKKHLGLGQARARVQAQSITRSLVVASRVLAWQAIVAAVDDAGRAREVSCEFGRRVTGASPPLELAGVLPRYRPTACARLVGAARAIELREQLIQAHDEDWFDNPRAHEQLREIDVTETVLADTDSLRLAASRFAREAGEVLG